MKNYELLYLVSSQYTEKELAEIRKKVEALIEKNQGRIGYNEILGKRKLAYPIEKAIHGYYVIAEFELEDGPNLKNISRTLELDKEVLRAQIIFKPKKAAEEMAERQKAAKASAEAKEKKAKRTESKPVASETKSSFTPTAKEKEKMKNLDEKLEEILGDDNII